MRKCGVNGTTWLSLSSISNLLDLWWENFKFPNMLMHRDTDVEMSNLYSWFCEDAKEGDEGGVNDIQGKGRRGDLFDNSSEHSRAKRSPFWSDALSSYTARTAAMYIHFQKLSRGFSSEYSKSL